MSARVPFDQIPRYAPTFEPTSLDEPRWLCACGATRPIVEGEPSYPVCPSCRLRMRMIDLPGLPYVVGPETRLARARDASREAYVAHCGNLAGFRSWLDSLQGQSFDDPAREEFFARALHSSWNWLEAGSRHLEALGAECDRVEAEVLNTHGGDI